MIKNKIFWIFLILIIVVILSNKKKECFVAPLDSNMSHPLPLSQRTDDYIKKTANLDQPLPLPTCCKVTRMMTPDGKWYYDYKKTAGSQCNPFETNIVIPNKMDYFYDGHKNWNSDIMCNSDFKYQDKSYLGSCRNAYNSCQDFITEEDCKNLDQGYVWSEKTCRDKIEMPRYYISLDELIYQDPI